MTARAKPVPTEMALAFAAALKRNNRLQGSRTEAMQDSVDAFFGGGLE